MVCSKRFWYAPSVARVVETEVIAASTWVIAPAALVVRSRLDVPRLDEFTAPILMLRFSPELAPTWKTPPPPVVTEPVTAVAAASVVPSIAVPLKSIDIPAVEYRPLAAFTVTVEATDAGVLP